MVRLWKRDRETEREKGAKEGTVKVLNALKGFQKDKADKILRLENK